MYLIRYATAYSTLCECKCKLSGNDIFRICIIRVSWPSPITTRKWLIVPSLTRSQTIHSLNRREMRSLGYKGLALGVADNVLPSDVEVLPSDAEHFIANGANRVIDKPITADTLKKIIVGGCQWNICCCVFVRLSRDDSIRLPNSSPAHPNLLVERLRPTYRDFRSNHYHLIFWRLRPKNSTISAKKVTFKI